MTAVRNRPGSVAAAFAAVTLASAAVNANGGECPGDMDADGEVSVDDLVAVIVEWGCTAPGPCAADVNADTRVTVEDLIMVLVSWGPCPGGATRAADAGLLFAAQTLAREAARFVPLERLAISPQCGFSSSVVGNRISARDQQRKLERVAETARAVWGQV